MRINITITPNDFKIIVSIVIIRVFVIVFASF